MNTKQSRIRRARKTRAKIAAVKAIRLAIHRTNSHVYAQIISADGGSVLASASSNDKDAPSAQRQRRRCCSGGQAPG
jgi:large subunit ribosomal protein L18